MKLLQTCTGREPGPPAYIYSFLLLFWVTLLLVRRSFVIFSLFYFSLGRSPSSRSVRWRWCSFSTEPPIARLAKGQHKMKKEREDFYLFPASRSSPYLQLRRPCTLLSTTTSLSGSGTSGRRLFAQVPPYTSSQVRGAPENNGRCITIYVVRKKQRPTLILATGQLPVLFIIIGSSSLYISTHSPPSERAEFLMRHSPVPREEQETDKCRQG